jgi:hypothetical protein
MHWLRKERYSSRLEKAVLSSLIKKAYTVIEFWAKQHAYKASKYLAKWPQNLTLFDQLHVLPQRFLSFPVKKTLWPRNCTFFAKLLPQWFLFFAVKKSARVATISLCALSAMKVISGVCPMSACLSKSPTCLITRARSFTPSLCHFGVSCRRCRCRRRRCCRH